ncbi:MAG: hypothetical protein PHC70_03405 [Patescibacteria group bacterium]|nr:hypothetical protein [Patescibacteria group bacterium]
MNLLEKLRLDTWYCLVLYLGALLVMASLIIKDIAFLNNRYLFGLGSGMVLIGLSYCIAEKKLSAIKSPNAYTGPAALLSWREIHHSFVTIALLIIGICLAGAFGLFIVKGLI